MDCSGFTDIEERLKAFPDSFQLDPIQLVNNKKRRGILDKLLLQRKTETMCLIEKNRNDNFASFLLFLLKDYAQAFEKNNEVIKRDPTNIVARANRVRFLYKSDLPAAEDGIKKLEEMKKESTYAWMHAVAEAELAFCLASTSPPCYFRAVKIYRSVNDRYPSEYLWKFGEALTIRRGITLNSCSKEFVCDIVAYTVRCNQLLQEIAENAVKPLKAKAWVQLAELSHMVTKRHPPFNVDVARKVQYQTSILSPKYCCTSALKLGGDDTFVLERSGKCFRYFGMLEESRKLLEKAIERRPTSFAHQHLAMTLIKMSENNFSQSGRSCVSSSRNTTSFGSQSSRSPFWLQNQSQRFRFSNNDPLIQPAIEHLRASAELSQWCNMSAINYLGFIYLQLENYIEADKIFRKIIDSYETPDSPVFTINAYEQTGLCCLRKSEAAGISQKEKAALIKEGKFFLTSAIDTAARLVSYIPSIGMTGYEYSDAFKTIADMLQSEYDSSKKTTELKEMARLYELVGKHKKSLDIYQKLCQEDPAETKNAEISIRLIENYLELKDYDNAKLCVSLLLCTNQAADVPRDLVNRVYLETARHILQGHELQRAHDSFKRAFELKYGATKDQDADGFDVMILHDEGNTETSEASQSIHTILETCTGLSITRNLEAAFGAKTEISSYELPMGGTRVLIVVLNPDPPDKQWKYWIDLALTIANDRKNMAIVCLTTGSNHPVTALQGFRTERTPTDDKDHTWLLDIFRLMINP
ncbi:uncharacterized protein LOC121377450 [Gigantopelta aegis]|uniref:uncharacterized protein LOC121377450 n=1 Tax=Gigantopelta aegis TaxID=1735272 RepID=UPI001B88B2E6|nr:uncharacterized protein LOC121377450 [Gigantopelta aegis]